MSSNFLSNRATGDAFPCYYICFLVFNLVCISFLFHSTPHQLGKESGSQFRHNFAKGQLSMMAMKRRIRYDSRDSDLDSRASTSFGKQFRDDMETAVGSSNMVAPYFYPGAGYYQMPLPSNYFVQPIFLPQIPGAVYYPPYVPQLPMQPTQGIYPTSSERYFSPAIQPSNSPTDFEDDVELQCMNAEYLGRFAKLVINPDQLTHMRISMGLGQAQAQIPQCILHYRESEDEEDGYIDKILRIGENNVQLENRGWIPYKKLIRPIREVQQSELENYVEMLNEERHFLPDLVEIEDKMVTLMQILCQSEWREFKLEHLEAIYLKEEQLANLLDFGREIFCPLVIGCFVRSKCETILCDDVFLDQITDVIWDGTRAPYDFLGRKTQVLLRLSKSGAARLQRDANDFQITPEYFLKWKEALVNNRMNSDLPSVEFMDQKRKELMETMPQIHGNAGQDCSTTNQHNTTFLESISEIGSNDDQSPVDKMLNNVDFGKQHVDSSFMEERQQRFSEMEVTANSPGTNSDRQIKSEVMDAYPVMDRAWQCNNKKAKSQNEKCNTEFNQPGAWTQISSAHDLASCVLTVDDLRPLISLGGKRFVELARGCLVYFWNVRRGSNLPVDQFSIDTLTDYDDGRCYFRHIQERKVNKMKVPATPVDERVFQLWMKDMRAWNEPLPDVRELTQRVECVCAAFEKLDSRTSFTLSALKSLVLKPTHLSELLRRGEKFFKKTALGCFVQIEKMINEYIYFVDRIIDVVWNISPYEFMGFHCTVGIKLSVSGVKLLTEVIDSDIQQGFFNTWKQSLAKSIVFPDYAFIAQKKIELHSLTKG